MEDSECFSVSIDRQAGAREGGREGGKERGKDE